MFKTVRELLIVFVLLIAIAPASVNAGSIVVEAEDFVAYNNLGGVMISSALGPGCSGGYMLIGLDIPREWTQYDLSCSQSGFYSVLMKCRGTFSQSYLLRLALTPEGAGEK